MTGRSDKVAARYGLALVWGILQIAPAAADSDLAVAKAVNDATLMPGAAVEFTVTVENLGPDPADAAVVSDMLPPGLAIPPGTSPVSSLGSYDAVSGVWALDTLAAGARAVLSVPAQVDPGLVPLCIVNRAVAESAGADPDFGNNTAAVALRQPGVVNCVHLDVELVRFASFLGCSDSTVEVEVLVRNDGVDTASEVRLQLASGPDLPPGLVFTNSSCGSATTCYVGTVAAGQTITRTLLANDIRNDQRASYRVAVTASSAEPDYAPDDATASLSLVKDAYSECDFGPFEGAAGPGCFIATAAYGSALDPHVRVLRDFRDQVLLKTAPGRRLVAWYYRYSPAAATYIETRPALRTVVRGMLWPAVMAIAHPASCAVLAGFLVITVTTRRTIFGALVSIGNRR